MTTATVRWYLIQSKPHQGGRAEENLRNQGYSVYRPRCTVERLRRGRRVICREPLFPDYLFIRLDRWSDNWHPIRSTRGVSRLVTFADRPAAVEDHLIHAIRERLNEHDARPMLTPGARVRIVDGCFRGFEAIFHTYDGNERAVLLIEFLYNESRLTVPLSAVARP